MEKMQKKIFIVFLVCSVLLVCAGLYSVSRQQTSQQSLQSVAPVSGGGFTSSICDNNGNSTSTTSPQTLLPQGGVASTTLTCYTAGVDQVDLHVMNNASSTTSGLQWQVSYSDNGMDWYYSRGPVAASNLVAALAATPYLYTWTPSQLQGVTATSSIDVPILYVNAKYTRVEIHAVTGTSTDYMAMVLKNIIKN